MDFQFLSEGYARFSHGEVTRDLKWFYYVWARQIHESDSILWRSHSPPLVAHIFTRRGSYTWMGRF